MIGSDADADDFVDNSIGIGANVQVTADNIAVIGDEINRIGIGKNPAGGEIMSFHLTSANLSIGGVWTNASDRNIKENIKAVKGAEILQKLRNLPITEWSYKASENNVRHIGPMAQDFYAAFGLGANDKTVSTIDPAGVALVVIQELDKKQRELDEKVAELEGLKTELEALKARMDRMEENN